MTPRRLAVVAVPAALIGGFVWLFAPSFLEELRLVAPYAILLGAALVLGLGAGFARPALLRRVADALIAVPAWAFLGGAAAIAVGAGLFCGWYGNGFTPGTPDEGTYLFQANLLAHGHLTAPSPPHWQFYQFRFCLHQGGRWFGIFPPGWPVVLALGSRLGVPHLVNPVLGGVLVVLVYPLARELSPTRPLVWRLAVALAAFSIGRMAMAASTLSHMLGAVCTAVAVLAVLRAARTGRARWWLLAGGALGLQATARLLNAFALGLPLAVLAVAFAVRERRSPRRVVLGLGALAVTAGAFGVLQLAYNHAITGRALEFPQRAYFAATEPRPRCSDPGFGPDRVCLHEHPPPASAVLPRTDFYPRHGLVLTRVRLDSHAREIAGGILLFPFLIIGLAAPATRRAAGVCALFYLTLWLAYATFYYHGLAYGARYYFEASPLVWVGVALGLSAAVRPAGGRLARTLRGGGALVVLVLIIVLPVVRWPWFRDRWFHDWSDYAVPMQRAMVTLDHAIIVHRVEMAPAIFNPKPWDLDSQRVIVARDFSPEAGLELLEHYPGRRLYRWDTGLQQPIPVPPNPRRVTLKGDSFFPADELRSAYAWAAAAPEGYCLKIVGTTSGAQAELRAHFRPGTYSAQPVFWAGADGALVRLELDGRVLVEGLDLFAWPPARVSPPPATVRLAGDQHVLRVILRGKQPKSAGYAACLDRVVLDRVGD